MSTAAQITLDPIIFDRAEHLAWWYEIRNEESVRAVSRAKRKIKADEHKVWWKESENSLTRKLFFVRYRDGARTPQIAGFVRLDHRQTWTEVSIAIKPELRGHGIAKAALRMLAIEVANMKWPAPGAVIHAQNHASLALFIGAGYILKKKGFVQVTYPTRRKS